MKKGAVFLIILCLLIAGKAALIYSQKGGFAAGITIGEFDSDGDGTPDSEDTDDDNDGLADSGDALTGNSSSVQSGTVTANVTIGNSINLAQSFSENLEVVVKDANVTLVNFSWDFSQKTLNLANVTVERETIVDKGSILMRGITLPSGTTKTLYVDNVDASIDRLCIKDAFIDKISEISSDCTGAGETAITCPGTTGGYACTKEEGNTRYKITGLSYTGIIEQAAPSDGDEGTGGTAAASGGGGGGAAAPTVSDFDIDKSTLKVVLRQGETREETINIKNTGTDVLDITTYLQALKSFIYSPGEDEVKVRLQPGESQALNLVFQAAEDQKPDVYAGRISLKSGALEKTISTIIEVDSAKPLFDVYVEVLPQYKSISPGEDIFIEVSLFNVRGFGRVDVNLEYSLKDFEGNIIAKEDETVAVETQAKFTRELLVPSDIVPGTYVASVKVTFEDSIGTSSDVFEAKAKTLRLIPIALKDYTFYLLLGIAAILGGSIYLMRNIILPKRKPAPKTKEEVTKSFKTEEKMQKLEKELAAMEKAYNSKLISEASFMKDKERIEKELKKLKG